VRCSSRRSCCRWLLLPKLDYLPPVKRAGDRRVLQLPAGHEPEP
jgi:hypothetical protein